MSKIYEALQNAQQESWPVEAPEAEVAKAEVVVREVPLVPAVGELNLENEMIALYQNIEALLPELDKKVLQFMGSRAGEGTSTVIREFARVAAKKLGKSVFLLDAGHHRNPTQYVFMHITPERGWESIDGSGSIVGGGDMDLQLPTGSPPKLNFYSSQILDFWKVLKQKYDFILIDSAPASLSPDGIEISRRVDGVVLVVEAEKTRWQVVSNLKEKIVHGGGNILGIVFNKRRYYIPDRIYNRL